MEGGASAAEGGASSAAPQHAQGGDVAPSQTLYIQNLTEKVKKAPLKKSLYVAFSPFGRVVDVVHCRSNALRGQAWVAFGDVASATAAMAKLQSFPLFDKPMVRLAGFCLCFHGQRLRGRGCKARPACPSQAHPSQRRPLIPSPCPLHPLMHTPHTLPSPLAAAHLLCQGALARH